MVQRVGVGDVRGDLHLHRVDAAHLLPLAPDDARRVAEVRIEDAHVVRAARRVVAAVVDHERLARGVPVGRRAGDHAADDGHRLAAVGVHDVGLDGRGGEARLEVRGGRVGEPAVGVRHGLEDPAPLLCNFVLGEQFEKVVAGAAKAVA